MVTTKDGHIYGHIYFVPKDTQNNVTGTDFLVSFRLLGHNRHLNRPKFMKPKLSVVINTSFLAIFPEFLPFILTKTT